MTDTTVAAAVYTLRWYAAFVRNSAQQMRLFNRATEELCAHAGKSEAELKTVLERLKL